jgi:hypothetical protein
VCIYFDKKTGWATFWATLSQAHPVTLLPVHCRTKRSKEIGYRKLLCKLPSIEKISTKTFLDTFSVESGRFLKQLVPKLHFRNCKS